MSLTRYAPCIDYAFYMKVNILIEGMDCAGKSTLAKELKNKLRWDMKCLGHREGDQFGRYLKEYSTVETVLERGHISEDVYSPIFKRETPFTAPQKDTLDNILRERFLIVMCIPDLETAEKRYKARGNMFQPLPFEDMRRAHVLFENYMKRFENDKRLFIYRSSDVNELKNIIETLKSVIESINV